MKISVLCSPTLFVKIGDKLYKWKNSRIRTRIKALKQMGCITIMIKWLIYKWIKRYCPHICIFCKYRKRCEYDRQTIFKKPPK